MSNPETAADRAVELLKYHRDVQEAIRWVGGSRVLYRPTFERSLAVQAAADAAALHMRLHPELRQAELIPVGETSDWGPLDEFTPMKLEAERTPDPLLDLQAQTNALLQAVLDELRALRQDARLTPHREAV